MSFRSETPILGGIVLKRILVTLAVLLGGVAGSLALAPASAQAASAPITCSVTRGYSSAMGGCNHYANLRSRMVITCNVIGSDFVYTKTSTWFTGRLICWGTTLSCHGGTATLGDVKFQYQYV